MKIAFFLLAALVIFWIGVTVAYFEIWPLAVLLSAVTGIAGLARGALYSD